MARSNPGRRTPVPSLRDIAAELDISVSLVSKVLSGRMGSTGVSEATREKILAKVRERNFVPNRAARALRTRRTGTIGVFLHPWGAAGTDITSSFLYGFSRALTGSAFHLWLTFFAKDEDFPQGMDLQNLCWQADAVVVAGVPHPKLNARLHELEAAGLPVITIFESDEDPGLTNVAVDCFLQGKLPTEHLLAAGCRRVVNLAAMPARTEGFLAAHREAGRDVPPEDVIPARNFSVAAGREAMRARLAAGQPFDGVVAHSDYLALGALRELESAGLRVPGQVRLTGVDNTRLAEENSVPLSSVTIETSTVGRLAAEMLLQRIAGESTRSVRVRPEFVARESSR